MLKTKLSFLGAAGTVTGSRFLLEHGSSRILVDCGLFQGVKDLRLQNRAPFPVEPSTIDAVILTHAHLDHSGYLPLLVKSGFKGPIYATLPTRVLSQLVLMDSAKIQEEDAEQANRLGYTKHSPAIPLYTTKDAQRAMKSFKPIQDMNWIELEGDLKFRLHRSGHILGASFVEIRAGKKTWVFSGDLGRADSVTLPAPEPLPRADYLILESTYGDRLHDSTSPKARLRDVIRATAERKGHVLIPSFAIGRTQDLIHLMAQLKRAGDIPDLPIFLDSPMGASATEAFHEFPEWHKLSVAELSEMSRAVTIVSSPQQSYELRARKKSAIVIAGSGMISGGRILQHLEARLTDPRNTILLVGYQAAGTRGRQLKEGAHELKMFGGYIPVRAKVEEIGSLSAHADQAEILSWLKNSSASPEKVFLVHGEPQASDALRVRIHDTLGWDCVVAKPFETFAPAQKKKAR